MLSRVPRENIPAGWNKIPGENNPPHNYLLQHRTSTLSLSCHNFFWMFVNSGRKMLAEETFLSRAVSSDSFFSHFSYYSRPYYASWTTVLGQRGARHRLLSYTYLLGSAEANLHSFEISSTFMTGDVSGGKSSTPSYSSVYRISALPQLSVPLASEAASKLPRREGPSTVSLQHCW